MRLLLEPSPQTSALVEILTRSPAGTFQTPGHAVPPSAGLEMDLWQRLGGAAVPAVSADVPGHDFWDCLCLVAHSPESQYDLLCGLSGNPALEARNLACVAVDGNGFHGQHGRPWQTAPGNLHLSVRLAVDLPAAGLAAAMMMLPAVALVRTLDDLAPNDGTLGIKWVNDILLGGHKVGGVLTHARSVEGRLQAVTFGLGLNLVTAPPIPATRITGRTTCLADHWGPDAGTLAAVLPGLLKHLAQLTAQVRDQGPAPLAAVYRERSLVVGRRVAVWLDGADGDPHREPDLVDRVLQVEDDLSLRLEYHDQPVSGGRLSLLA